MALLWFAACMLCVLCWLKHLLTLPVSVDQVALIGVCVCIQQWQEYQLAGVEEDDAARM